MLSLCLGAGNQEASDGVAPLTINILETFAKSLVIRYHYVVVSMLVVHVGADIVVTGSVWDLCVAVFLVALSLKHVMGPFGVFAPK